MTNIDYALIYINYLLEKIYKGISPVHVVQRRSKTGVIARISPEVQNGIYDIDHIKHLGEYSELVAEFKTIFDEKLSHYNNTALYDRLETIQIENTQDEDGKVNGRYNDESNIVLMYTERINKHKNPTSRRRNVLFHELIHMATSYSKGIISMVGFGQMIASKYCKGKGLNEGYTELINQRYFQQTEDNEYSTAYPKEQELVYGIEMLVGKEKMEKLFFNADLDGLINEMSKYMPLQETNILINNADLLEAKTEDINMITAFSKAMIANRIIERQEQLYSQGLISKEEYEFKLLEVEMFTRGFSFRKSDKGYELAPITMKKTKTISDEGYRILQNCFKQSENYDSLYDEMRIEENKKSNLIFTFLVIEKAEKEGTDLSQIETIEVTDPIKKEYKTTPRVTTNTSSELSEMIEELEPGTPVSQVETNNKK